MKMVTPLVPAMVLAISAVLSACSTTRPAQPLGPARMSEMTADIDVAVAKRVLTLHFLPGLVTPPAGQIDAFNALLGTGDVGRGDRIVIERGQSVLADTRARVLAAALAREGLRPVVAEPGDVAESELRLVVEHAEAQVHGCPNWSKPPGNDAGNTLPSDFGCASAMDLAAMVADPRDLVEGRPLAPVVGDAAILAVHRYRSGAPEQPDATGPVYFPDRDRQGRTTIATAPGRSEDASAAQSAPAGAAFPSQAGSPSDVGQAAAMAGTARPR
jgi:pilus assembly protein CpaD